VYTGDSCAVGRFKKSASQQLLLWGDALSFLILLDYVLHMRGNDAFVLTYDDYVIFIPFGEGF
jgi:hypothetical protein